MRFPADPVAIARSRCECVNPPAAGAEAVCGPPGLLVSASDTSLVVRAEVVQLFERIGESDRAPDLGQRLRRYTRSDFHFACASRDENLVADRFDRLDLGRQRAAGG